MDLLQLMNNDMATLKMSSQQVFELWQDDVAISLRDNCVNVIQSRWNIYMNEMNTYMRNYMHAEKEIDQLMKQMLELAGK